MIRVPVCARVSLAVSRMCPVCVPAPPGVFLPVPVPYKYCSFPFLKSGQALDLTCLDLPEKGENGESNNPVPAACGAERGVAAHKSVCRCAYG